MFPIELTDERIATQRWCHTNRTPVSKKIASIFYYRKFWGARHLFFIASSLRRTACTFCSLFTRMLR